MLQIVKLLIDELNNKQINYVHFKSNAHLDKSSNGLTDFDLLISKETALSFEKMLLALNFKRFISQNKSIYPGVDDWLGYDIEQGRLVHLHIHYQIITGQPGFKHVVLPWIEIALSSYIIDEQSNLKIVNPSFEILELYTRIILKQNMISLIRSHYSGKKLPETMISEAVYLRNKLKDTEFNQYVKACFGEVNSKRIKNIILSDNISAADYRYFRKIVLDIEKIFNRGIPFVYIRSIIYSLLIKTRKYVIKRPNHIYKKISNKGGLIIAFIGSDGSGKSTISNHILSWLSWKLECRGFCLGLGRYKNQKRYKLMQKLKSIIKKHKVDTFKTKIKNITNNIERKSFSEWFRQRRFFEFSIAINKDIQRINAYKSNGGIAVIDRYPQIQYHNISDGPKVTDLYPKMQEKEITNLRLAERIEPDIVFKLIVPLDAAIERRPENSKNILEKKIDIINKLKFKRAKVYEIDATLPYEEELLLIKHYIWENI